MTKYPKPKYHHKAKDKYVPEGTRKRSLFYNSMPKSLFFNNKDKIYMASVTESGQASGLRTDLTSKALELVAHYIARLSEINGQQMGIKTKYGILRLDRLGDEDGEVEKQAHTYGPSGRKNAETSEQSGTEPNSENDD